jgi:hypothetical protein
MVTSPLYESQRTGGAGHECFHRRATQRQRRRLRLRNDRTANLRRELRRLSRCARCRRAWRFSRPRRRSGRHRCRQAHITTVLRGLHGKVIGGKPYAGEMPAYRAQLSDAEVAAVIDHERTSWGNKAPVVTPDAVKALR